MPTTSDPDVDPEVTGLKVTGSDSEAPAAKTRGSATFGTTNLAELLEMLVTVTFRVAVSTTVELLELIATAGAIVELVRAIGAFAARPNPNNVPSLEPT